MKRSTRECLRTLGHRPDRARRHDRRNATAPWVGGDAFDGAVCVRLAASRRREEVIEKCWKDPGRPEQVHIDNAREWAGWGRRRALGRG